MTTATSSAITSGKFKGEMSWFNLFPLKTPEEPPYAGIYITHIS